MKMQPESELCELLLGLIEAWGRLLEKHGLEIPLDAAYTAQQQKQLSVTEGLLEQMSLYSRAGQNQDALTCLEDALTLYGAPPSEIPGSCLRGDIECRRDPEPACSDSVPRRKDSSRK